MSAEEGPYETDYETEEEDFTGSFGLAFAGLAARQAEDRETGYADSALVGEITVSSADFLIADVIGIECRLEWVPDGVVVGTKLTELVQVVEATGCFDGIPLSTSTKAGFNAAFGASMDTHGSPLAIVTDDGHYRADQLFLQIHPSGAVAGAVPLSGFEISRYSYLGDDGARYFAVGIMGKDVQISEGGVTHHALAGNGSVTKTFRIDGDHVTPLS